MDSGVLPRHAYTANDMISGYKVLECRIRQQHDWSQCFYAHPQERARRRSLQKYSYAAVLCPDMVNSGSCRHGGACDKSHSVFEFWLHPDKYCTRMCHDGAQCKRPFCFFAHASKELRTVRGNSDTRVRQKNLTAKPAHPQQQQRLQGAVAATPAAAQAVPGVAADSRNSSSNSWQAYALPETLASSDSLQDEALSPPKHSSSAKSAGSSSSTSVGSSSGRDSASSSSSGSNGNNGSGASVAAAAGSTADTAQLQQLQLQLQYETCSRGMQPSIEPKTDTDGVWSSVDALLSCLSLEESLGQVNEAAPIGADAEHDAPAAAAAATAVVSDGQMQQGVQPAHCVSDSLAATDNTSAPAGLVELQPAQQWQPAAPADICHSRSGSSSSSLHVPGMAGSLWGAAAAAVPAACPPLPAIAVAAGFMSGSILQDGATSSSNVLLASSSSQQSLNGLTSLTQSTAVDPADSVLDYVASLGLFGAVQPRTAPKQQQ